MHKLNSTSASLGQSFRYRSPHRRRRAAAVARAFTGARLLLGLPVQPESQAQAAMLVASSPLYIAAAGALLEAENPDLIKRVCRGDISLLDAAASVRKRAQLVKAYRR